jgi:hypothetical protein
LRLIKGWSLCKKQEELEKRSFSELMRVARYLDEEDKAERIKKIKNN